MNWNKLFHYFWGGIILILPLYISIGLGSAFDERPAKDFLLFSCAIGSAVLFGIGDTPGTLRAVIFAFCVYVFFNKLNYQNLMFLYHFGMVVAACLFCLQIYGHSSERHSEMVLNAISVACLIQAGLCIANKFGFSFYGWLLKLIEPNIQIIQRYTPKGSIGSLGNQNIAGSFLAICAPALFRKKWAYTLPIVALAIGLTKSTTPVVAVTIGLLTYFLWENWKNIVKCWPIVFAAGTVVYPLFVVDPRSKTWKMIMEKMNWEHFLFGKGLGFWAMASKPMSVTEKPLLQMHNEYLELVFATGLVGVVAATFVYLKVMKSKDRHFAAISMAGLASCFSHFTLHGSATALVFLTALFYQKREVQYV